MRLSIPLLRPILMMVLSAIAEKNPLKAWLPVPVTLSTGRIVYLAVATTWCISAARFGVRGWPEAVLGATLVFAPIIIEALSKADPAAVAKFGELLISRYNGAAAAPSPAPAPLDDDDERGEPDDEGRY